MDRDILNAAIEELNATVEDEVVPQGEPQYKPGELYDMLGEYAAACHLLGINTRNMSPTDLYLTTGRVIHELIPYGPGPMAETIRKLTREQKLSFCDKVLGVVSLPKR